MRKRIARYLPDPPGFGAAELFIFSYPLPVEVVRRRCAGDDLRPRHGEGETRVDALRDVRLEGYPEQVLAPLGPSRSGKTALLNVTGCFTEPSKGRSNLRDGRLDSNEEIAA